MGGLFAAATALHNGFMIDLSDFESGAKYDGDYDADLKPPKAA
jgi:hypothetical protein